MRFPGVGGIQAKMSADVDIFIIVQVYFFDGALTNVSFLIESPDKLKLFT